MKTIKQLALCLVLSCVAVVGIAQNIALVDTDCKITKEEVAQGLTSENFPRISSSDYFSAVPNVLAADLLGLDYYWRGSHYSFCQGALCVSVNWTDETMGVRDKIDFACPNESYPELIDGNLDMVISGRELTDKEKTLAKEKGVELLQVQIGKDALVFVTGSINPVGSLATRQIQDVFAKRTVNWSELGGKDEKCIPTLRNVGSDEEVTFVSTIGKDLELPDYKPIDIKSFAEEAYGMITVNSNAVCYMSQYFFNHMVESDAAKMIEVDGVAPTEDNVKNGKYPYSMGVYVTVRADIDKSSKVYQILSYLATEGLPTISSQCKFIPIDNTSTGIEVMPINHNAPQAVYSVSGRKLKEPCKGLNIIRCGNGKTRKLIVR